MDTINSPIDDNHHQLVSSHLFPGVIILHISMIYGVINIILLIICFTMMESHHMKAFNIEEA